MGQFINSSFLWWLIPLIAAPIIIHLLNRRKHRRVPWAAMRFLEAAFKRTNRRVRIEHLILLLLRILIMALLVLAISRPMVTRDSALAILGQNKRNLVLLVDTSYSMTYRGGVTETHFDRAIDIAKEIVTDLSTQRGDTLTLVSVGEQPDVLHERSAWIERGIEDVAMLEPASGEADVRAALTRVLTICDHPEMQTHAEVIFLSDFQRKDWDDGSGVRPVDTDAAEVADAQPIDALASEAARTSDTEDARDDNAGPAATLEDMLAEFGTRRIPVTLIDVGGDKSWNLAVTSFETQAKAIGIRRPTRLSVEVTNWGSEFTSPSVSLWIGEDKVATKSVGDISPNETKTVSFLQTFHEPGDVGIRAEIDPEVKDRLEADNVRYRSIRALDRVKVLLVDGDDPKPGQPLEAETGFLRFALDPYTDDSGPTQSLFAIDRATDYDLALQDFSQYDWIAIANLYELDDSRTRDLARAVRAGASLLLFVGDRVDPARYNGRLFGDGEAALLPGRLEPAERVESGPGLEYFVPDFNHPVVSFFEPEEFRPLLTSLPKTRAWMRYEPGAEDTDVRILARYGDETGAIAICERLVGSGRVVFFTTTADDEWTTLPKEFGFVMLVQEIGTYLAASDPFAKNILAGEPLTLELPRFSSTAWVELPNGERRNVDVLSPEEDDQRYLIEFEDTSTPGFYSMGGFGERGAARVGDASSNEDVRAVFAANVATREGDLRPVAAAELQQRFPNFEFAWKRDYAGADDSPSGDREGEIWKYLLAAVLGLLLLEGFLAQFFGDYSRR